MSRFLLAKCKDIEKYELTENEKAKLPGSFINLPCGSTHYEMKGSGEPVVLVTAIQHLKSEKIDMVLSAWE